MTAPVSIQSPAETCALRQGHVHPEGRGMMSPLVQVAGAPSVWEVE